MSEPVNQAEEFQPKWQLSCLDMTELFPPPACNINPDALGQLYRDEPGKRRKVYLEFDPHDVNDILDELSKAGFDMTTLKRPKTLTEKQASPSAFNCLITGPAQSILKLLKENTYLLTIRVDLPEYSWLSFSNH